MDEKLVYKIASRGEGKTRWLLEKAEEESRNGNQVYLATKNPLEYSIFVEKFLSLYQRVCTTHQLPSAPMMTGDNCVLLIDELLTSDVLSEIDSIVAKSNKVYATLNGKAA